MKLLRKMWIDERLKFFVFFVLMSTMSFAQVLFWPSIAGMLPAMKENVPAIFGGMIEDMDTLGYNYFLVTQLFFKLIGFFGAVYAVLLGANTIVRERENRTLGLLASLPVSRGRLYWEKVCFSLLLLALTTAVSVLAAAPATAMVGEEVGLWNLCAAAIISMLVLSFIYATTVTVSLFLEDQMQSLTIGFGFIVIMSIIVIFEQTKHFSIYIWLRGIVLMPVLQEGSLPWPQIGLMTTVITLIFLAGFYKFHNMDI